MSEEATQVTPVEATVSSPTPAAEPSFSDAELTRILQGEIESAPSTQPAEVKPAEEKPLAQPEQEVKKAEENKFAHKFTALAKQQQKLLEKEKALKAQEESIKSQSSKAEKFSKALEMLDSDPIGALEAAGIDPATLYANLTEQSLSGSIKSKKEQSPDVLKTVEQKIEELRKEMLSHELEKERMAGITQAHQVVSSDPDRWAYIQANGVEGEVWNLVEAWYGETGEVLDFETAADKVEAYLESEAQKYIAATQRKQQRQAQPQQAQPKQPALATQPSTLTNAMAVKTPPSLEDDWEKTVIDPRERKERLLKELAELKIV